MNYDFQRDFETLVIREWKGHWAGGRPLPLIDRPAGGYVLTFHRGTNPPYKAEHYPTWEEIVDKYGHIHWMQRHPDDAPDIVLVGI
jgi:hypothetical protein